MDEPIPVREDLQELIPWFERRGIARCGFDRKQFRFGVLIMACMATGFGVYLVVSGHGWGIAAGCVGIFGLLLGITWVRSARCVVEVDFDRSEFHLHNFVYPRGFWDVRRKPLVTVPFGEIRGVSLHTTKGGRAAYVGTRSSRFQLSDDIQHFDRIVQLAEELAGPQGNAAMRRASALRIWVPCLIGGALVCLLAWIAISLGWV